MMICDSYGVYGMHLLETTLVHPRELTIITTSLSKKKKTIITTLIIISLSLKNVLVTIYQMCPTHNQPNRIEWSKFQPATDQNG